MNPERKSEIESAIIRAFSGFGIDASKEYQSLGLIGLSEMRRDIPREELLSVLKSMPGVIVSFETFEVSIPTSLLI